MRDRFEGVANILRFNWPFYLAAVLLIFPLFAVALLLDGIPARIAGIAGFALLVPVAMSLIASSFVYDFSTLYDFRFLQRYLKTNDGTDSHIVNIHAGFDETSQLIRQLFPQAKLTVLDFYDPAKHTEASIERARRNRSPFPGTLSVKTDRLPLESSSVDLAVLFLSAHEIRDSQERLSFFRELHRILAPNGTLVVTEHLRDLPNFIAYTIGFFHFLPRRSWETVFRDSGFEIRNKTSYFRLIHTFILKTHGPSSKN